MKKFTNTASVVRRVAAVACACAFAMALAGCTLQQANETADENAAANRQFIAQLNNKTGELAEVLDGFQTAVAEQDAVGMKAASSNAQKIIAGMKELEAPTPAKGARTVDRSEDLNKVKDLYVEGMEGLNAAMDDYASLYTEAAAGKAEGPSLNRRLSGVQDAYDAALEKLSEADALLSDLGNDTGEASSEGEPSASGGSTSGEDSSGESSSGDSSSSSEQEGSESQTDSSSSE